MCMKHALQRDIIGLGVSVDQDDNTSEKKIGTQSFFNVMLLLLRFEWIF
eukprot:CAMPEP_0194442102 /NCGR_PEP_ID=MMETSP0176-20130528/125038_1 /TAXON_ID=216777 /ORGANISM="Proboscia alata, Strain PI-D3" /LENGTH=48 /DNA_ID= /DNA_START= /DNA_END= /DNA_ORIENTATION=